MLHRLLYWHYLAALQTEISISCGFTRGNFGLIVQFYLTRLEHQDENSQHPQQSKPFAEFAFSRWLHKLFSRHNLRLFLIFHLT